MIKMRKKVEFFIPLFFVLITPINNIKKESLYGLSIQKWSVYLLST